MDLELEHSLNQFTQTTRKALEFVCHLANLLQTRIRSGAPFRRWRRGARKLIAYRDEMTGAWNHEPVVEPFRIVVDGETFDVQSEDGSIQFSWVSGPNAKYGFATRRSDGAPLTEEEARAQLRGFLSSIDPATGYVAD